MTDYVLKPDLITTKQLLASIAIMTDEEGKTREKPSSVKEIARYLSTSHQNITKISLQLEGLGLLEIKVDPDDRRRKLLVLTEKSTEYWNSREDFHREAINSLFEKLSKKELMSFHKILQKLLSSSLDEYTTIRPT
jgi:DNA-binding MarR family transcriptional regulator